MKQRQMKLNKILGTHTTVGYCEKEGSKSISDTTKLVNSAFNKAYKVAQQESVKIVKRSPPQMTSTCEALCVTKEGPWQLRGFEFDNETFLFYSELWCQRARQRERERERG